MTAGSTYTPIATTTLGSAASSVTFNSFSGYTDLILIISNITISSGPGNIIFRVNGDSSGNYSRINMGARALSTTPFTSKSSNVGYGNINEYTAATTTQKSMSRIHFMNYSNSTNNKTVLVNSITDEGDATYSGVEILNNLWRSTAAITSIVLSTYNGANFNTGSTFTLYGIAAA